MSEIEKQFMEVFDIKPIEVPSREYDDDGEVCSYYLEYPQITDRILLELIRFGLNYDFVIHAKSKDELKEKLLTLLIHNDVEFKYQVQAIFEEAN